MCMCPLGETRKREGWKKSKRRKLREQRVGWLCYCTESSTTTTAGPPLSRGPLSGCALADMGEGTTRPFSEQLKFPHDTLCASVSSAGHASLWKLGQVCGTKHSQLSYSYSEVWPVFAAVHLVCNVWECEAVEPHLTASVALLMHLCCRLALTNQRHIVFQLKVTKDRPAENKDLSHQHFYESCTHVMKKIKSSN